MLKESQLKDYQKFAIDTIIKEKKHALFLEMGMGKTVSTLSALSDMLLNFEINKVLIVAPLRVANTVWHKEIESWEHLTWLKYSIITGTEKKRLEALNKNAHIYIINRENIPWLVNYYASKFPFDSIVIDESSSFKNPTSQRFKLLKKVIHKCKVRVMLTGTPAPNGYGDLWSQIYLLDEGLRLGHNITMFRNRYFYKPYPNSFNYVLRDGSDKEIKNKIQDISTSMESEDYLDLPSRVDIYETCEMDSKLNKQYKLFQDNFILDLENELKESPDDEKKIIANSSAILRNKQLQFCNGAMYGEEGETHDIHNLKIKRLKEIVDDNPSENFLIAYNYKSDLEKLTKAFPEAVILDKSMDTIDKWNRGEIKMLLAHPQSAGHGLNIQHGGNICVWYGLTWSLEYYEQFNARLHRQGQKKMVKIIHLVVTGNIKTCDEIVLDSLKNKSDVQNNLKEYLKKLIKFKI